MKTTRDLYPIEPRQAPDLARRMPQSRHPHERRGLPSVGTGPDDIARAVPQAGRHRTAARSHVMAENRGVARARAEDPTMSDGALEALERPAAGAVGESGEKGPRLTLRPLVGFVAAWLGGSWLVVGAWLSPLIPGGWGAVAAGLAAGAIPVWTLVRGLRGTSYPSAATRLLVLRPFWYAMLFMPVLAAATLIGALAGLPFGASGLLGRWALAIGAAALAVAVLIGFAGSRQLAVRRLEVRMPRLPAVFDGLRLVQISDLHVGPHTSRRFLERIAKTVRRASPQLIVVTGDQVDVFARDVECFTEAFGGLQAPHGTYVVAGNHDVYAGWEAVRRGLADAGLEVLENEAVSIARGSQRLWIAGTGDPAGESWPGGSGRGVAPDIGRTLAGIPPGEAIVALAHNPVLWPELASRGVDLTLSGHTHYGQLAIPSRGWSMASPFQKLAMGWHRKGRSLLYIHPGTNYWGIPFRIGTPPEVAVLTLRAGGDAGISDSPEPRGGER